MLNWPKRIAAPATFVILAALAGTASAGPAPANVEDAVTQAVSGNSELDALTPSDASTFCLNFEALDVASREVFWRDLLTQIAESESDGVATRTRWLPYDSAMHRPTFRRGLFQISSEAAASRQYQCDQSSAASLNEPTANAACAVKILVHSIETTGAIQGAGAYWPTIAHRRSRTRLATSLSTSSQCTQGK